MTGVLNTIYTIPDSQDNLNKQILCVIEAGNERWNTNIEQLGGYMSRVVLVPSSPYGQFMGNVDILLGGIWTESKINWDMVYLLREQQHLREGR